MLMDKNKKEKLSKLKMPAKREDDLDLKDLDQDEQNPMSNDDEASESPELEKKEEETGMDLDGDIEAGEPEDHMGNDKLAHVDDEELLAELKKRGLISKLHESDDEHLI